MQHKAFEPMVRSALVVALLASVACATNRPISEQIDDSVITGKIETKLAADPQVSGFNVGVDTIDGVVRLSGTVETDEARDEAEKLARDTEGVLRVDNDIEIGERTMGERLSDAGITTKIKAKLTVNPDINPFNIDVDTNEGVVTLSGKVATEDRKREAEEVARNTKGVRDVHNRLEVEMDS